MICDSNSNSDSNRDRDGDSDGCFTSLELADIERALMMLNIANNARVPVPPPEGNDPPPVFAIYIPSRPLQRCDIYTLSY